MLEQSRPEPDKKRPGKSAASGYLSEDTIAALATATGGAIAVIRVSGPQALRAVAALIEPSALERAEARKLVRAPLRNPEGEIIDDVLFARFISPESYTGEDSIEIHTHGGGFIAQRVMEALASTGIRQALPGEFSFRAVRNGKMSVSQAQAVADLISATNDSAATLALEKMSGTQNRLIQALALDLRQLAMLGEVGIDFADQNVDEVSLDRLKEKLQKIRDALERLKASYDRGMRIQDGVAAAFVGLPNAGKSSFFNALLGEDRSIVSEIAGTTRDVIREKITLRNERAMLTLRLEDTAGLRKADDEVEKIGIERSRKAAQEADLLVFIADPGSPINAVQEQWQALGRPAAKTLGIITKRDLFTSSKLEEFKARLANLEVPDWIETSAMTGHGIAQAIDAMIARCARLTERQKGEVVLTRLDHLKAVIAAIEHIQRAEEATEIDLFASDLRQALHALAPIIGDTLPDDILGKIFSEFCIGK